MGKMSEPQEIPKQAKETSWIKKLCPWTLGILWGVVIVMLLRGEQFETVMAVISLNVILTCIWDLFWYFKK
jgi:hypothetical protein